MSDMDQWTWRRGTAEDEPLLFTLFAAAKTPEFAPLGWSPQQLQPLLEMQFRARRQAYNQSYPAAVDMILCRQDGTPVGRQLMERQPGCYRCIDLAVLPEYRNRGIGTWTLRQIQQLAALDAVPLRLCVERSNPAIGLYERLGFVRVSSDELSYEMEWHTPRALEQDRQSEPAKKIELRDGSRADREEVLSRIFAFVREIGLELEFGMTTSAGIVPGVQLVRGGLRIDLDRLTFPGDLLHEAGHLAVMTPERRLAEFPSSDDPAEEMAALAWSYAAALQIGVAPEIVFHDGGYRGQARAIQDGFATGNCMGLPILWWLGLTTRPVPGCPSIYPQMLRWLREEPCESDFPHDDHYALPAH